MYVEISILKDVSSTNVAMGLGWLEVKGASILLKGLVLEIIFLLHFQVSLYEFQGKVESLIITFWNFVAEHQILYFKVLEIYNNNVL